MEAIKISVEKGRPENARAETLILGIFENSKNVPRELKAMDKVCGGTLGRIIGSGDFSGKMGQFGWMYPSSAPFKRLLVVGLGSPKKFTPEIFRRAMAIAASQARRVKSPSATIMLPEKVAANSKMRDFARAAVEGFILGAYKFADYKGKIEDNNAIKILVVRSASNEKELKEVRTGVERGTIVAQSVVLARDLANTPGNDLPPEALADIAKAHARKFGLKCTVLKAPELKRLKMNALLAVGSGSSRPPCMTVLEYRPKGAMAKKSPLVLVGKGITFDSGGISIKPSQGMEQMKDDMSGAAAVLATLIIAARRNWNHPVIGLMPAAENLPGSKAYRPGDVIKTAAKISIEVISTDAEGRLILADALHYAHRFKPAAVVDVATLTGACVIALGNEAAGLMSNDDKLSEEIREAGEACGERVWPLPLWEEYDELIKSDVADIKNVAGRPAGTIVGGCFLAKFAKGYKWAHLDIASTAWSDRDWMYRLKGATGAGVRILAEFGEKFEV